jgi:hypothetical protein
MLAALMNRLLRQIPQLLRADRRAALAVAIAVLVNVVIAAAYVWSRGGQTTEVTVVAIGDDVGVVIDGDVTWIRPDVAGVPPSGGIVLTLADTTTVPSLPTPRGIASVVVRDQADGTVLFEDDFADGPSPDWELAGGVIVGDGVVGSRGDARLTLAGRDWQDYAVTVRYQNVQSGQIIVRARNDGYGAVATVRPFHWNEDFSKWLSITAGRPGATSAGVDIELDRVQSMKSMLAMLTRPYPYVLLLALAGLLVVGLLRWVPLPERLAGFGAGPGARLEYVAGGVAFLTFAIILRFYLASLDNMPYVPDSIAYIFQAKIFASGRLTAAPPPVEGAFDFFVPAPFSLTDSTWAAQYPFAHPLALAAGQVFNAPWVIPPLFAAGSVALMFFSGRRLYGDLAGLVAAVLLATSPLFIMNASDFMSHNTAGFFLLASLACLLRVDRRPVLFGALAGLGFGLLLNTRPLTALALTPPFGAYLLYRLLSADERVRMAKALAAFAAVAGVMALLFLGWNYTITGDAFRTGYQATGVTFFPADGASTPGGGGGGDSGITDALGIGGSHAGSIGIQNERIQLGLLLLVLDGWPQFIGLAFSLLPFLLGTRKFEDWFFLASAVAAAGVWVAYESTGVMYGPRYWYEAMPFLLLLAVRGADRLAVLLSSAAAAVREGDLRAADRREWTGRAVVYGFMAVLIVLSVWGWLLGQRTTWDADLVPNRASATCCLLGLDDRIYRLVEEQDLHNALVLVDPCDNNFVCYGSVFWRNNPTLDGDVVYVKDIPGKRQEILGAYPGRAVYVATYLDEPQLRPLSP